MSSQSTHAAAGIGGQLVASVAGISADAHEGREATKEATDSIEAQSSLAADPSHRAFKVQAPKPCLGIQYRGSKNLDDRYPRYAANGSIVRGQIQDGGQWLKTSRNVYLPMTVGSIWILEALAQEAPMFKGLAENKHASSSWWCCNGGRAPAQTELVFDKA